MNTKETSDKTKAEKTKNNELETVEHTTEDAPAFETDIDPIEVLETLDGFIETLNNNPKGSDIQVIEDNLASMAIIAVGYEDNDKSWWMNAPVVLHRYTMKRSMGKRIGHLLKSGGEWKGGNVHKENVEAKWQTDLPMSLTISEEAEDGLKNERINKLFVALVGIHQLINNMLEKGEVSIGVFHKTDAIVYMNILKGWIELTKNPSLIRVKDEIQVMTLDEVAQSITLSS